MRLLLDAMCGGLTAYLRMCGHDAAYALDRTGGEDVPDEELVALAAAEDRRIVTRDRNVAALADDAILLTERDVVDQLRELAAVGVELELEDEPTRCGTCNGPLTAVDPTESTPDYAPDPADERAWRCRDCGQYFWKGSHWDDVAATLAEL
ncbi:Mut7-C RNAse domain-containing protein [Halomicrobium urmianum]|uniref:Mut7-C RNAse domain-containing protein n=1 Tax=Halomicrobium urmianum TaxID=1586233 RepID=UPI001CD94960|nr:Mut7-C RNAse domain-containing protein [Halomicrobium urmianum]